MPDDNPDALYIVMISIHGLIRGENLELGRDADTGGQCLYVVELARALARNPQVARVDVLTRQVIDAKIDDDYARPVETMDENAYIVRIPCGPRRYLRKEKLWPYLDSFTDQALQHIRGVGLVPAVIHGHYADAGYVGAHMASILGVPFFFTGHSLGRIKRERLLKRGQTRESIEHRYHISTRIEAEEIALETAQRVITSTRQEIEEQYSGYHHYQPDRMVVIPPGVDLSWFHPPRRGLVEPPVADVMRRFLRQPKKPMILTISRPDERKNIHTLVRAYGESPALRELANLVILAGSRDDIRQMDKGPRTVLSNLLLDIDRYDLYGRVAYPKEHQPEDVADLYRLAAQRRGVFVNPALTEPFGLTLIEAAASGLPVVATEHGGPRDIIESCRNGYLIDPFDHRAIAEAIRDILADSHKWRTFSRNGINGAHRHYSWEGHVTRYLKELGRTRWRRRRTDRKRVPSRSQLVEIDRLLISDIDNTLIGDPETLPAFLERLRSTAVRLGFGIATGRQIDSALAVLKEWGIPVPDILITAVGSEIHYGNTMVEDRSWRRQIGYRWRPDAIREVMAELPGLRLQPDKEQRDFKISWFIDEDSPVTRRRIIRHLRQHGITARVIHSHDTLLDILPIRASKGLAIRFLANKWGLPPERILVAGDSGNDEDMLSGSLLGVVVGNHSHELQRLRGKPRIYFARAGHAAGILEGIDHYNFLGTIRTGDADHD